MDSELPEVWLDQLRRVARRGRASELVDLIAQIEANHASLARALRVMVEDYQFRQIVALIERLETSHDLSRSCNKRAKSPLRHGEKR